MISKDSKVHEKHAFLTKPQVGSFHRNEWAILGTSCGQIKILVHALTEILSIEMKIAYVDADHKSADNEAEVGRDTQSNLGHGGNLEYTDKITYDRFDVDEKLNDFQLKPHFNSQDLVIVNGNHFRAKKQIVVIDPKKNLEKRIDQLTEVDLFLTTEDHQEFPEVLVKHIPTIKGVPVLSISDHQAIASFLKEQWQVYTPVLNGLVLAGGKSTRMGQDKGKINYNGKDQRIYMWEQLSEICDQSFISIRPDQQTELSDYPTVSDTFTDLGPYGAILSAFRQDPNAAWMVVACDQPLLDLETLSHLKSNRNVTKMATTYHNSETNFPEPLITIWEPRAYPVLLNFLSLGYSCPRKALINSDCEVLTVPNERVLKNANTPREYEELLNQRKILSSS